MSTSPSDSGRKARGSGWRLSRRLPAHTRNRGIERSANWPRQAEGLAPRPLHQTTPYDQQGAPRRRTGRARRGAHRAGGSSRRHRARRGAQSRASAAARQRTRMGRAPESQPRERARDPRDVDRSERRRDRMAAVRGPERMPGRPHGPVCAARRHQGEPSGRGRRAAGDGSAADEG